MNHQQTSRAARAHDALAEARGVRESTRACVREAPRREEEPAQCDERVTAVRPVASAVANASTRTKSSPRRTHGDICTSAKRQADDAVGELRNQETRGANCAHRSTTQSRSQFPIHKFSKTGDRIESVRSMVATTPCRPPEKHVPARGKWDGAHPKPATPLA
jgi:hypothetical protein